MIASSNTTKFGGGFAEIDCQCRCDWVDGEDVVEVSVATPVDVGGVACDKG